MQACIYVSLLDITLLVSSEFITEHTFINYVEMKEKKQKQESKQLKKDATKFDNSSGNQRVLATVFVLLLHYYYKLSSVLKLHRIIMFI